jgi:uncharacterized repeat protein (TIGR02543 family)
VHGNNNSIRIWGELSAVGTKIDPIIVNNLSIYPGNSQASSDTHGLIAIKYTQLYSSKIYYPSGDAVYGSLILTDSYIENLDYMYIWYPVRDSVIQRNVFIKPNLISSGLMVNLNVSNNLFYKQSAPLTNWAAYGSAQMIVEKNSFLAAEGNILALQYDSSSMTAPYNYWGGLSDQDIQDRILDKNDDLALPGYIEYQPILSEPDAGTPKFITHTVTVGGIEGGVVLFDHQPLETNCNSTICNYVFFNGVITTLSFVPEKNYTFNGWTGDCSSSNQCTIRVDSDKTINASVQENIRYNKLVVTKTDLGNGTIASIPAGISCGTSCLASFKNGTSVTLNATPDSNYVFSGWGGGSCSGTGTCTVTMDSDKSVTASFTYSPPPPNSHTLSVSKVGSGTITSVPASISCGATCSTQFVHGSTVSLLAQPDYGFAFAGWSGACASTGTCVVTMDSDKSVSANFIELPKYPVKVTKPSTGVISSEPAGILCGGSNRQCASTFSSAKLIATPNPGYEFIRWNGCQAPEGNICYIKPTGKMALSAVFKKLPKFKIKISKNTLGSITSTPAGLNCPDKKKSCVVSFIKGTEVTLNAAPQSGRVFVGWGGACSGTDSCQLLMDGNKSLGANFQ